MEMFNKMKLAIGNDHTALELKNALTKHLEARNIEYFDFGTNTNESVHYPEYGEKVALAVSRGEYDGGILLCGTGIGMSIAANKVNGIRAALCSEPYSAKMSKEHNNANIICFGARVIGSELAKMILDAWLDAEYLKGRHHIRVDMFEEIEKRNG